MATKSSNTILHIVTLLSIFLPNAKSIQFNYPAVFNFGDSNSDTGELTTGLGFELPLPYGQTYLKTSSTGRFCDGRLIVDFLSKFLTITQMYIMHKLIFLLCPIPHLGMSCSPSTFRHDFNCAH